VIDATYHEHAACVRRVQGSNVGGRAKRWRLLKLFFRPGKVVTIVKVLLRCGDAMVNPTGGGANAGLLRVMDGDDVEWKGINHRLADYDTPETRNFRSRIDRELERRRGLQATFRLQHLIQNARTIHMIPWEKPVFPNRPLATLLIDGWDVARIATRERWGIRFKDRKKIDWGDPHAPFDDALPMPRTVLVPATGGKVRVKVVGD
jgi:endonuclease YncB( thermonuclease family)